MNMIYYYTLTLAFDIINIFINIFIILIIIIRYIKYIPNFNALNVIKNEFFLKLKLKTRYNKMPFKI